MPELCDIINDGGTGADAPVHFFTDRPLSNGFGTDRTLGRMRMAVAESGQGSDAAAGEFTQFISEAGSGTSAASNAAFSPRTSVADLGSGIDAAGASFRNIVVEAGSGADALAQRVRVIVAESGSGADAPINRLNSPTSVAEAGSGRDAVSARFQAIVSEAGSGSDLVRGSVFVFNVAAEAGSGSSAAVQVAALRNVLSETGSGVSAATQQLTASNSLEEYGSGVDAVLVDSSGAWVAGINRMPMSRWSDLPGTSIAFNEDDLLVGGNGLWRSTVGDVEFSIDLGASDFVRMERKHLAYAYATGQISASLDLVVQDHEEGGSEEWTYSFALEDGEEHETIRVNLGRGHRSRYFNFRIDGSGQAQLTNLQVRYDLMSRRI